MASKPSGEKPGYQGTLNKAANQTDDPVQNTVTPPTTIAQNQQQIDTISRFNGLGALSQSTVNLFHGINHRGLGNPVAVNTDQQGLTFFTRPRMNLSYDNIAMDRVMTPLLTDDPRTLQRVIRTYLDPDGHNDRYIAEGREVVRQVRSDLTDQFSPFIGMLTNTLISLTGWPDIVAAYFDSAPGPKREVWGMIDDTVDQLGSGDLTATFRNVPGDPITLLFHMWLRYYSNVYLGKMMPYPDSVLENEIDYQTRIYRLILDPTRQYVQKIAVANACVPLSPSMGQSFDFSSDNPFSSERATQITIPFHCWGFEYNDPILIREFNDVVFFFNRNMATQPRVAKMVKIPYQHLLAFNGYGYPYIDPRSNELQWWIYRDQYNAILSSFKQLQSTSQTAG